MKYRELYRYGLELLAQAGISEAGLDARLLLEHVCHTDRNTLLAHGDMEVEPFRKESYASLIRERASHIPLQHLTGVQEFMGLPFLVDSHALIPRQDTEILVEEAMSCLHDGMAVLDMCTGSGCILLSLLRYSNHCTGVGVDISEDALSLAERNARLILGGESTGSVSFVRSDLFQGLEKGRKFDLLVSNPPYIPTKAIDTLMPEVRDHEPHEALDGGEDGLDFYRSIAREAKEYLYRGAHILLETGFDQEDGVKAILEAEGWREIRMIKDYGGMQRVAAAVFYE